MLLIPVILSLNQCSIIGTLANPVRKAYQKKKKKKRKINATQKVIQTNLERNNLWPQNNRSTWNYKYIERNMSWEHEYTLKKYVS